METDSFQETQNLQDAEEFKIQGNEYFKNKNYHKAIEYYTKAIKLTQKEASYYGNRAACYLALKLYKKCIEDCNTALELDPKNVKCLRRKGLSFIQLNRISESAEIFKSAKMLDPNDKGLHQEYQDSIMLQQCQNNYQESVNEKKYAAALSYLNQMIIRMPDSIILKQQKVECLAFLGMSDQANILIQEIKQNDPNSIDLYYLKGIIEMYSGKSDKAKQIFQEGLKRDPDNMNCRNAIRKAKKCEELKDEGNQLIKNEKYQEAIDNYCKIIELDPFNKKLNAIVLANRALAYMKINKYDQAQKDCDSSIELDDKYSKSYLRRAEIKMKMKDFDGAIFDYKKIQEIDPTQNVKQYIQNAQLEAKKAKQKDYYKVLDLNREAVPSEIKKSYHKLALQWHPDRHISDTPEQKREAEQKFRDINEAYQVLSDPKKKEMFDQGIDPNDQSQGQSDVDPQQIFRMFFGGSGGEGHGFSGFPGGGVRFTFG